MRGVLTPRRRVLRAAQDGNPPVRVIIYCHGNACDIGEVYVNLKQCVAPDAPFTPSPLEP